MATSVSEANSRRSSARNRCYREGSAAPALGEGAVQNHRSGVPRSPGKRYSSLPNIFAQPLGTCPRIPPFPGMSQVLLPSPPPPPPPAISTPITPVVPPQPQPNMVYRPISESSGYRLMMSLPVGHREDGTYGLLTCGVRPDQEYRLSTYYVNSVTYYNVPMEALSSCETPTSVPASM